ncbi:MAG: NADH-quinone oxidoreductase subunit NuoE [Firmicutes bacterium]|jgi:NADH-quinone oxidoreductase subunit E|nr:NADH-quinone oxidoreductase subunit NuoE [Bacillota bacterium]
MNSRRETEEKSLHANPIAPAAAEDVEAAVQRIVRSTPARRMDLIPILQAIQAEYRYLPEAALRCVARELNIPPATVYGVATFYSQFALNPKGKWVIQVCNGTACHVRGAKRLLDALNRRLGLTENGSTTGDGLFTLEIVSCLGACGLAPVVVVGDKVHGQLTEEAIELLIDHLEAEEGQGEKVEEAGREVRSR